MRLVGIYTDCDTAVCINCMTDADRFALDHPADTGEISADNPAAITTDTESDTPTWCSIPGCSALIPHALTSEGYAYVRDTDWRADLADDLAAVYGA